MVAIRRRQRRRTLAAGRQQESVLPVSAAVTELVDLVEAAGRPCTVTSLGRDLGIDQPRASKLAAHAVDAGLLCRAADQQDGRRSPLELTAAGRDYLDQVHQYRRARFGQAMTGWTDTERATFARLLTEFVSALEPGRGSDPRTGSRTGAGSPAGA